MDWLDTLNPAQRQAVTTTDGPLLIVAGPGSGKTRVIVHRIAYLIQHAGVAPWNILAVTFTNKAAKEMRERLDTLLSERQIRALTVGTFHATCARWLRTDGESIGLDRRFTIYDDGDQLDLVKRALSDLEMDEKKFRPRTLLATISGAKNESISPERYAGNAEGFYPLQAARVYTRYQELLDEFHGLDFDDLLGKTLQLFTTVPEALEQYQDRFPYLMVDEFQDTNVVQYELDRLLGQKRRNVCIVGDEDQSIYGWRKADVRNLQHFERDFPELNIVLLEQNYRSTQAILDVAGAVISPNENRKPKTLWTENPRGEPVQVHEAYDERDEALFVVRKIEELRRDGARYGDVAITYRTNAQSRALEDAFVRYGVPYTLIGGTPFYQRREIKDLLAYIRLIGNPADGLSFERVVNVPARGIGQKTVGDLLHWSARLALPAYQTAKLAADGAEEIGADGRIAPVAPMANRPRTLIGKFVTVIEGAQERLAHATLSETIESLLEQIEYKEHLVDGSEEGNDRWQNVQEFVSKLHDYDTMEGEAALRAFLEEAALVQAADGLESGDAGQVTLITLHAAKGLEFPIVFIVGLEDGLSPHSRAIGVDGSMDQLEEERRLLYVGVTRAEQRLFLLHAAERTVFGERREQVRSCFLDDIPPHLLTMSHSQIGQIGGGARQAERSPGRAGSGWGRGLSSGYGSRGEAAARYREAPAAFRPSSMPGREAAARPQGPGGHASQLGFDTGIGGRSERYGGGSSANDLGVGAEDGPDLGVSARAASGPASGQRPAPIQRPRNLDDQPRRSTGAPAREGRFKRNDRVKHAEYGTGTVIASSAFNSEELVLVRFDSRPDKPKNLSLSIHRLDPA